MNGSPSGFHSRHSRDLAVADELGSYHDPLPQRALGVTGEQGGDVVSGVVGDPDGVRRNDQRLGHRVHDVDVVPSLEQHQVAPLQLVEITEWRAVGGAMAGEHHVAGAPGRSGPDPVPGTSRQHSEIDPGEDDVIEIDGGDPNRAQRGAEGLDGGAGGLANAETGTSSEKLGSWATAGVTPITRPAVIAIATRKDLRTRQRLSAPVTPD